MFGEQFQQTGVGHTAIQNDHGAHACGNGGKGGFGFGNHTACDGAIGNHRFHVLGRHFGNYRAFGVFHPGHICKQQQAIGAQRPGQKPRGGIAVYVEGFIGIHARGHGGHNRDNAGGKQIV